MYSCPTTTASIGVGRCPNCGYSWSNGDHDVTPIGPASFTISCASRPEYFDPPGVTYNYHVWAAVQLLLILLSPMRLWPQARAPPVSLLENVMAVVVWLVVVVGIVLGIWHYRSWGR